MSLATAIVACSIYANLAFVVTDPAGYRFFPPFKPNHHAADGVRQLGAEYFNIARSLTQGKGFADPFAHGTGATAWMPPILCVIEAGMLWVCDGNRDAVAAIVVCLQVAVLISTGVLVLSLTRQTACGVAPGVVAAVFLIFLLGDFRSWFQSTYDAWLVLLAMDLLLAGFCWFAPLECCAKAAAWGCLGGIVAQINPIVGLVWCVGTMGVAYRLRAWSRLSCAVLLLALTLAPWTIRNYLVFGRWLPVKSNLAYELYQSQCLQPDGLLQDATFLLHPYGAISREGRAYRALGEMAFLDRKAVEFWQVVAADPMDFVKRVGSRFMGATLWYVPLDRHDEAQRPWLVCCQRVVHPLPFLGLLVLAASSFSWRLHACQRVVIGVYALYLLPYVVISYYERYALPLLGVKALLVIWAAERLPGIARVLREA